MDVSVDRVPVDEAARRLGIKAESIRKRIYRGSLKADKEPDGRLMVYLDDTDEAHGQSTDEVRGHESGAVGGAENASARLIEHLEAEIEFQRRESERKDAIIMQLSQANAEQARTIRVLEAPREPPEATQRPQEAAQESPQGDVGVQDKEPAEPRPWWRRVFGG